MTKDISKFNVRNIPQTKSKKEVLEFSKSSYELFYEKYYDEYVEGWSSSEAYSRYKTFAENNKFAVCSVVTFGKNIKQFAERKQRRVEGERECFYIAKVIIEENQEIDWLN